LRQSRRQDISSEDCFEEISFFLRQGYEAIAPGQWQTSTSDKAKLLVTFDDGNRNTLDFICHLASRQIPVLLAVNPGVVESGEPFWFEEIFARLELSRQWQLEAAKGTNSMLINPTSFLIEKYFSPKAKSIDILAEVRAKTSDVTRQQVLDSGCVHKNMDWKDLGELLETGFCTLAAHGLSHDAATHMSADEFEQDAIRCRTMIKSKLGFDCVDYVYPFGSADTMSVATEAALMRVGYQRTYTTLHKLNRVTDKTALGRFTGIGLGVSPRYYESLWMERHLTSDGALLAHL